MKLIKLVIENFKGITKLEINPNGKNINIFGDNATGKTTVIDAFMWLLFDKDSSDKKDFRVKPLDNTGKVLNSGSESIVIATIMHNGETTELKKTYKEKWTKKNGSSTPVFGGNKPTYYIDGLEKQKGEYELQINNLCDKEVFKMVTNPLYFSSVIKWVDRRKVLFEICDNELEEDDIINSKSELAPLMKKGKHSVSNYKKKCESERVNLNKQLDELPIRISELNKTILNVDIDIEYEKKQIKILKDKKSVEELNLQQSLNGQHSNVLKNQISELNNKIDKLNNENEAYKQQALADFNSKQYELIGKDKEELQALKNEKYSIEREIKDAEYIINKNLNIREKLLSEYKELISKEWKGDESCPTCNQSLPTEIIEKSKEEFNNNKSIDIEKNICEGKSIKHDLDKLQATLKKKQEDLETIKECIYSLEAKIENNNKDMFKSSDKAGYLEHKSELLMQISNLQLELEDISKSTIGAETRYKQEISTLQTQIDNHEKNILKVEQLEATKKRIEELEAERVKVANEVENLDRIIYLCDEFTKHKVALVEENINSKFKIAKFKLFETQINGGIKEVCEVTHNGVPFTTNLNTAAKINVGIDIINTLTEHYKFEAPIFIDNAESVTKLFDTNSQVIRLVVSEINKNLLVETA